MLNLILTCSGVRSVPPDNVCMVDRPLASHLLKTASSRPGGKPGSPHMWEIKENSGKVPSYQIAFFPPTFFALQTLAEDVL